MTNLDCWKKDNLQFVIKGEIEMYYGAIEAGGTKFVCAVSDENLTILKRISIPTTIPEETMTKVFDFFDEYQEQMAAIGIGSFGPIDVNPDSPTYGFITSTPKLAWKNYPFLETVKSRYACPVAWTTDVNAAAFGELKRGAAKGKKSCLYITVGTGIGGGVVVGEKILSGYSHPELGHILVRRHSDDEYQGTCPYHDDCLEGLAAGPAIEKRTGLKGQELKMDDPVWKMEAYYLAQALMNYTLTLSPEKIVFGGGVMKQKQLIPLIQEELNKLVAGYVSLPPLEEYIVLCELEDDAGITGCILLAQELALKNNF